MKWQFVGHNFNEKVKKKIKEIKQLTVSTQLKKTKITSLKMLGHMESVAYLFAVRCREISQMTGTKLY